MYVVYIHVAMIITWLRADKAYSMGSEFRVGKKQKKRRKEEKKKKSKKEKKEERRE